MPSDGELFSSLSESLISSSGQVLKIEPINKVVFLQENDKIFPFNDELDLNFALHTQSGQIDMVGNRLTTTLIGNVKILIEINLLYSYEGDFSPRYTYDIYKNGSLYSSKRCGLSDEIGYTNNLYLITVIDSTHGDLIELKLNKDTTENSEITIKDNSFITFKTF
jgi:hypothetical protein